MKILIIGGTRFLGKELLTQCLKLEYKVVCLSRKIIPKAKNLTIIHSDRDNGLNQIENNDFDVVIDFIGYNPQSVKLSYQKFKSSRYFLISSAWVSQFEDNTRVFNNVEKEYVTNKILSENILLKNQVSKSNFSIIRIPIILGKNDHSERFSYYQKKIIDGEPIIILSDQNTLYNETKFCFKDDIVKLILNLIQTYKDNNELIYEALPNSNINMLEFINNISRNNNMKGKVIKIDFRNILQEFSEFYYFDPFSREKKYNIKYTNLYDLFKFKAENYESWLYKTSKYFFKKLKLDNYISSNQKWNSSSYKEKYDYICKKYLER